jgi:hypothetical protein
MATGTLLGSTGSAFICVPFMAGSPAPTLEQY